MQYRREIDGLRALAVVPVILFHAGVAGFSGGYVGVDIFFVISGYLITRIILEDLQRGTFSILRFYERRARRILPALFLVMACSLPFAWLLMMPGELEDFAKSVLTTTLFVSNVQFWQETGYFAAETSLKPLLHTWSLAIEEQYYLFAPVVSILLWSWGKRVFAIAVVILAVVSFVICEWMGIHHPAINFFFTPSRVWELMFGALGATLVHHRERAPSNPLSLAGLAGIIAAIAFYDEDIAFPSHFTLLPVIGTCLILVYAGRDTMAARLLSWKPFVGIGLVSYSAYLWHQPVLAFARMAGLPTDGIALIPFVAAIFGLAYLSWRYVEQPFRNRTVLVSRRRIFSASAVAGGILVAFGSAGFVTEGFPDRTLSSGKTYRELRIDERLAVNAGLSLRCNGLGGDDPACRTSATPRYALWGDSYAMHLANAMMAGKPGIELAQFTKSFCAPVRDAAVVNPDHPRDEAMDCIAFNAWALKRILESPTIEFVVLSSAFSPLHGNILHGDGQMDRAGQFEAVFDLFAEVVETLRAHGKEVVLVSPMPGNDHDLGSCLARIVLSDLDEGLCDFPTEDFSGFVSKNFEMARALKSVLPVIMLDEITCKAGMCDTMVDGTILYRDGAHLSREGSNFLGAERGLMRKIDEALAAGGAAAASIPN